MGDTLKDKVAVVTGAGRGIGRAIALALAEEGAKVVVNDLGTTRDGSGASSAVADEVVAEIKGKGGEAVANYDSVTTTEGGENIIKTAVDNFGRIDILVNNAGITRDRMVFNMTPEEWDSVIKTHLYGVFNCTKPAAGLMRQQGSGRIINITSTGGLIGTTGQANYGAAKAGIAGFTRVVARDLEKYGVTVNAVAPNALTRMTVPDEEALTQMLASPEATAGRGIRGAPVAEDNAPIVAFLASDAAADITGWVFGSCGGRIDIHAYPEPIKSIYKDGRWTVNELENAIPALTANLVRPKPLPITSIFVKQG